MSKWIAKVKGTLHFIREITVYACSKEDAGFVAEELTMLSADENSCIHIEDIEINPPDDPTYEISISKKYDPQPGWRS